MPSDPFEKKNLSMNYKNRRDEMQSKVREYSEKYPGESCTALAEKITSELGHAYSVKHVAKLLSKERSGKQIENAPKKLKYDESTLYSTIDEMERTHPNTTQQELSRKILREYPELKYSVNHLALIIREKRKKNGTAQTITLQPGGTRQSDKYTVQNGRYAWFAKRGAIELPVELVDQLFYEYSRHGLDMSQQQIRAKHNLKIWQWNSLKFTLFLYKDSNVFSPHTEETTPPEELEKMIAEKMQIKSNDKHRLVETAYQKETLKRYKEIINKDAIDRFATDSMAAELDDIMSEWKCKTATVTRTPDARTERKWIVATIADLHIGARVEGLKLTPEFSPNQCRNYLDQIARKINAANATDVTIAFMGDLIETFTGLNHKNSWQSVEYGMVGANVIKEALSIIEEFIGKITNVREILGVSGNHDRITSDSKEDRKGQVAEIIFYMLKRLYGETLHVEYEDLVLARQIDGIQYVLAHGDKKTIRDGKQTVIDHGDSKLFNLIITAHYHNRKIMEDNRTYRWISVPAVFSGNRYSEENAWRARPGFDTFENDGTGMPLHTCYTIL